MKDSFAKTLGFACLLGIICATTLAVTERLTLRMRNENEKAEKLRNVLDVLGVDYDSSASSAELLNTAEDNGVVKKTTEGGLEIYELTRAGRRIVAVEFSGPGMWSPIRGFLAFDVETKIIAGISFYEQAETPGLGGKISEKSFCNTFKGKSLAEGKLEFVSSGSAKKDNEVESISGATVTSNKVKDMLNRTITKVMKEVGQ